MHFSPSKHSPKCFCQKNIITLVGMLSAKQTCRVKGIIALWTCIDTSISSYNTRVKVYVLPSALSTELRKYKTNEFRL